MARCVTTDCPGTKLAAVTLAEWNARASLQPATPTSCPYKGPFGCKCEPGECRYTPTAGESEVRLVCSNKPRPSVQKGAKGNQFWRPDVHHIAQPPSMAGRNKLTLCGIDASDWLAMEPPTSDVTADPNLCKRCAALFKPTTASDAVAGEAKAIGWISEAGLHTLQNDNDATICCDNSPGGFNIPVFLRSTSEAATPSEPVAWREETFGPGKGWYYSEQYWTGAQPLYAAPQPANAAQSVTEPSDEWCNAFLKATGEWIEPHEPETECGVPMECEITQEFADELNADARKQIRKGYAAACSIPSTNRGGK
jgi:hypothetical protein